MSELPDPADTPRDDPDLEAALRDPTFDDLPSGSSADPGADPARPEDIAREPDAPHLALDEVKPDAGEDAPLGPPE